ncbi:type III polyketide synthase [Fulvivirga lutimaris]|uniref:type III polyketide synthase n=1 Tax=Fulvivirga lutimaris TaxID=1819566 RepID=UPI0012BC35B1|nr:type III polyketide synthase [Fulvivirga lutimaris]MTI41944.1 type III polyketide synthase [Fulvivirga lutimaris]
MNSYITSISTAKPKFKVEQSQALDFMSKVNGMDKDEKHNLEVLYRATGIESRFSVLEDFTLPPDKSEYFNTTGTPSTAERLDLFKEEALKLSFDSAKDCISKSGVSGEQITHIITVSCTGLHAPGLDIDLIYKLGLQHNVERLAINFMGCYAAFNAIKAADAICQSSEAKVLIICTELCSIHFQKGKDEDTLLANALFGDGSAALMVESIPTKCKSLKITSAHCDLLPAGKSEMAWGVGDFGFEMKLSSYVPDVISTGISTLLKNYSEHFDYYAIHPGGKRILKVIEEQLNITKEQNIQAHEVLRQHGNMSSPTILFVLKHIFDDLTEADAQKDILAMAFGPGLTLESLTFKITLDNA